MSLGALYDTFDGGKMTYWADNIKFVKDLIDSKYKKIDDAIVDVRAREFGQLCVVLKSCWTI